MLMTVLATMSTDAGDVAAPPVTPAAALPASAQAQRTMPAPPMPEASLEGSAPRRWYGWELMLSDAAFLTLASRYGRSGPALLGGVVGITLATPLLHVANGNGRAGMRSIAVRSATWLAAAVALIAEMAIAPSPCHSDSCSGSFAAEAALPVAILLAGAVFVLVDDTALATVSTTPDPRQRVALSRSFAPARFVPTLSPTAGGATMGLGGVF